jgi:hypothetical protein
VDVGTDSNVEWNAIPPPILLVVSGTTSSSKVSATFSGMKFPENVGMGGGDVAACSALLRFQRHSGTNSWWNEENENRNESQNDHFFE